MALSTRSSANDSSYKAGAFALALALGAILVAHGFERFGGYAPCELCLQQRWAYYAGIPALFLALVLLTTGQRKAAGLLFFLVALAFLANTGLGIYHSGVEWKFWPGPTACSTGLQPLGTGQGGILEGLKDTRVVRCDEAAWRKFGLSFAGWNAVLSVIVFAAAVQAAFGATANRPN